MLKHIDRSILSTPLLSTLPSPSSSFLKLTAAGDGFCYTSRLYTITKYGKHYILALMAGLAGLFAQILNPHPTAELEIRETTVILSALNRE